MFKMIREMTDVEIEKLQQTGTATLGAHSITADEVILQFTISRKLTICRNLKISQNPFLRFAFDIMPSQRAINSTRPVQRVPCWFY